jgi:hypothetical protein
MLGQLRTTLDAITARDPEQEVKGIAVPVLDAVLASVRTLLPDHPVVQAVREVISPEAIAEGEPVRAADALIVVDALLGALPPPPAIYRNLPGRLR